MGNLLLHLGHTLLLLSASHGAIAANIDAGITPEHNSDTVVHTLHEFKVTSSQVSKQLTSAAPVYNIGHDDINKKGIVDLSDAIKRLPGVMLRDYGGAGGLKTVSVRGLGTQHTGVTFDGAPLSDVQSGQIDLSRYSLDNIHSVSLRIGDNEDIFQSARSSAAANNLILSSWKADVQKGLNLTAQLRGGAFGFINPYLQIGYGNGRNLAFLFTGDYTHADNNYKYTLVNVTEKLRLRRTNSDMNAGHMDFNIRWLPSVNSSLSFKGYYFDSFRHLPGPAIMYNTDSKESLKEVNAFGQADYRIKFSNLFSFKALAKFNWASTHYIDINGKYPGGKLDNRYLQRETYATASLLCLPIDILSLSYSIDWFYNDLRGTNKDYTHPHRNSILQSLAAKMKVWRITMTARALLSIYHDTPGNKESSLQHTKLSPSFGISLQPIAGSAFYLRANYKNIFRMPSFSELYFDHYGSINLKPENTEQFNAGVTYAVPSQGWLDNLEITADFYYNHISNKIIAIPYNMFVWTMTNMGKVRAWGVDLSLNSEFPIKENHKIIAGGSYSLQKAVAHTSPDMLDWNKQIPYTPVNTGSFSVSWENPWVSMGIHGTGCSERFTTGSHAEGTRIPGYMEFGFLVYRTFNIKSHKLELRADLINAFNKQYEIIARYPMPGISWQVSAKFTL